MPDCVDLEVDKPAKRNFLFVRGASFTKQYRWTLGGLPVDLTGKLVKAEIANRELPSGEPGETLAFVCAVVGDPTDGTISITLTSGVSKQLVYDQTYYYDLWVYDNAGFARPLLQGTLTLDVNYTTL